MAEYIERKAFIEAVKDIPMWGSVAAMIADAIPAADVAPVVHGRWMPFHSEAAGDIQYCSACEIGFDAKTDYCPHCGAEMDGGDNDAAD